MAAMRQALHVMAGLALAAALYAFAAVATPMLPFGPFLGACVTVASGVAVADWYGEREQGERRRRRRGRLCRHCGYNLRGNVSGACPECGAACTGDSPETECAA